MNWIGFLLVVLGGIAQGFYTLPMKYLQRYWKWENIWFTYAAFGLVLIPWVAACILAPIFPKAFSMMSAKTLLLVIIFGAGWGIGSTTFGLGVDRVGMAIAFAIILGLCSSLGSLLPMLIFHPEQAPTRHGILLIIGVVVVQVGLVISTAAGRIKDRNQRAHKATKEALDSLDLDDASEPSPSPSALLINQGGNKATKRAFFVGIGICLLSGVTSSMLNFASIFAQPVVRLMHQLQTPLYFSSIPTWAIATTSGFLANAAYTIFLMAKNRSAHLFCGLDDHRCCATSYLRTLLCIALCFVMGLLWIGGTLLYGAGATLMGTFGPILGWASYMSISICVAFLLGLATGEWRHAGAKAVLLLTVAIVVIMGGLFLMVLG